MILDEITAHKKQELKGAKSLKSLQNFKKAIPSLPKTKSLWEALTGPSIGLIAEIKKGSPSKGVIRHDFNPSKIAAIYEKSAARAISVLTDEKFFFGCNAYLQAVRRVTNLPLLRKDFILDPWQVYESRVLGADAILLIVGILDDNLLMELHELAGELGLECLVEVHREEELERALNIPGVKLIGINNRDLRNFRTDLDTTLRLKATLEKLTGLSQSPIGRGMRVISESGINSRAEVALLEHHGVHGILVGEALMRENDIGAKIGELLGQEGGCK